jgi:hypothetical protein
VPKNLEEILSKEQVEGRQRVGKAWGNCGESMGKACSEVSEKNTFISSHQSSNQKYQHLGITFACNKLFF